MKNLFFAGIAFVAVGWYLNTGKFATGDNVQEAVLRKTTQQDSTTLEGRWYLQPVLPSDTAAGKIPTILFNTKQTSFTGNTGCNRMSGTFKKTDTSLIFNERITLTKMACTGYNEDGFIKSLLHTNRYKIENGVLILMFDMTELSRWSRKQPAVFKTNKT